MAIFEAAVECVLALSRSKESFCSLFEANAVLEKLTAMWPASSPSSLSTALALVGNLAIFTRKVDPHSCRLF